MLCTQIEILEELPWVSSDLMINGRLILDLKSEDESIPQNIKNEELTDFNKIQVNESIGVDVPKTPRNDMILSHVLDHNTFRRKNGILVRAWQGASPLIWNRLFVVKDNSSGYSIELRHGDNHWVVQANRLHLNKLDLGEFEFSKNNVEDIQENNDIYLDGDLGIYFPLVNFGSTYRNGFITPEDYRVHHYVLNILQKGFCAIGYTFKSPIFESTKWRKVSSYILSATYGDFVDKKRFEVSFIEDFEFEFLTPQLVLLFDDVIVDEQNSYEVSSGEYSNTTYAKFLCYIDLEIKDRATNEPWVTIEARIIVKSGSTEKEIAFESIDLDQNGKVSLTLISDKTAVINTDKVFVRVLRKNQPASFHRTKITILETSKFFNEPIANFYSEGDIIDLAAIIHPDYTFADFLKGLLHPISGMIVTNWTTREVTIYPPNTIDLYGEQIEGYNKEEYINIQKYVVPGSRDATADEVEIKRYAHLHFKKGNDQVVKEFEELENELPFAKMHDFGERFKDSTKDYPNPFFEATLNKEWKGVGEQTVGPYVPHMIDNNNNELSFDISPRILYIEGKTFMRSINADRMSSFTYEDLYVASIPLAFQQIKGFQKQTGGPGELEDFETVLIYGDDDNDFFNLYWKKKLQSLFDSVRLNFLVHLDLNTIDLYSLRKRYVFVYNDIPVNARIAQISDFNGCSSLPTPVDMTVETPGSDICADDDVEIIESLDCFENTRRLTLFINENGNCYNAQIFGTTPFVIDDVIYEWRYVDETEWTPGDQICDPDRQFVFRAIVQFDNDCPDLILVKVVEPCVEDSQAGIIFNYNFNTNCLNIQVTGVDESLIDNIDIQYSDDDKETWQPYTEPICDFEGEICFEVNIELNNGCPDIFIEDCFSVPPSQPPFDFCGDIDADVECSLNESNQVIPVRIGGDFIFPEYIMFDLIQYRYNSEDQPRIWDEVTPLDCPVEIRRVIIFCNNFCDNYCGEWVTCECDPCTDVPGTAQNASVCNDGECQISLLSRMSGADTGGSWTFDGYAETHPSSPGSGGTDPGTLSGDNPTLDFDGWIPGFYHFTYTIDQNECDPISETLIIQVMPAVSCTPDDEEESYCEGETGVIDLHDIFGTSDADTCKINDIQSTGNDSVDPSDIDGTEVDLTEYEEGNYQLTVTYGTNVSPEFQELCGSCTLTVTFTFEIENCNECEADAGEPVNTKICN